MTRHGFFLAADRLFGKPTDWELTIMAFRGVGAGLRTVSK